MKEVKANRVGGPYMIQDSDHMSGQGQVGGEADSRQSEQSQGETRQQTPQAPQATRAARPNAHQTGYPASKAASERTSAISAKRF